MSRADAPSVPVRIEAVSFDAGDDTIIEIESEGGELTVELSRWYAREKASRLGRHRAPGIPEGQAMMSEIAVIIARQRGLYLAEEVDSLIERERGGPGVRLQGCPSYACPWGQDMCGPEQGLRL